MWRLAHRVSGPQVGRGRMLALFPGTGPLRLGSCSLPLSLLQDDQGAPPAPWLGDEVHRRGSPIFCGPQLSNHHL